MNEHRETQFGAEIDANTDGIETLLTSILATLDSNNLSSQTLLRATFIDASLASDGVLEIIPDPAAATTPKIVALVFTQTVQGLTEIRVTGAAGAIIDQYYRPAYDGVNLAMAQQPHLIGTVNESVVIKNKTGATCAYAGHVVWYLEA